ncbi:SIS domain-containing protein [Rarobacter faecitabidus]|uniref:Glutamine--fructose-6-phosphate aminotransferase [isomerizing] n=1 Tax=Rarobacter faecitabidus TaxID=13243 RepID=A0A542ZNY9_RARFA|nr:SIS domain-containing protein [Rarobacter faecitabidus]TQL62078.1 glucosamine--fructose-6-phosphate aminotransferase (isomerizing) [Rarobacter faecitabidus]
MSYLDDIKEQPAALRRFVQGTERIALPGARAAYDRIILTGMGGSHFANYYLWRALASQGIDTQWVASDELLSWGDLPAGQQTLVIAVSQSGGSGEVVTWAKRHAGRSDIDILAVTNNPEARELLGTARASVQIVAGPEETVSTKTYLNTLAAGRLIADAIAGQDPASTREELVQVADGIEAYLDGPWHASIAPLIAADGEAKSRIVVGRDAAIGTALQGALIIKEAAKVQYEALSAGQFRHGPLDLADPSLLIWLFTGGSATAEQDEKMVRELVGHGARVVTSGSAYDGVPQIELPATPAGYEEFGAIVPIELATIPLAEIRGLVPGEFRHNQKVTTDL